MIKETPKNRLLIIKLAYMLYASFNFEIQMTVAVFVNSDKQYYHDLTFLIQIRSFTLMAMKKRKIQHFFQHIYIIFLNCYQHELKLCADGLRVSITNSSSAGEEQFGYRPRLLISLCYMIEK